MEYDEYSLIRLFDTSSSYVIAHIAALPESDRYLRFGYSVKESNIKTYVDSTMKTINTRTHADFWFGIKFQGEIVATIHIAIRDDVAEFGFTTDVVHRGKKLGQMLFARGIQLVTEYNISRIYVAYISSNGPMKHIAKKFGLAVMSIGTESEASVNIAYPVPLTRIQEIKMSVIDKNIFIEKENYVS